MAVRIDGIGNVVGRYEGDAPGRPALLLGSHLDTVRNAGKYDDGSELYITQIRPNALKVQDAIERLVALQINVAAAEFAGARAMSDTIHWWMLAATALALLAGAAMAWVITRSISRPLRQAVVLARTVAGAT